MDKSLAGKRTMVCFSFATSCVRFQAKLYCYNKKKTRACSDLLFVIILLADMHVIRFILPMGGFVIVESNDLGVKHQAQRKSQK